MLKKYQSAKSRKRLLSISIIINLGVLFFFKYFDFFAQSFSSLLNSIGLQSNTTTLNIILPVGISFYTLQTLSYTIDVYRNKIQPTKNFISFSAFVCFFPQLVAGPIERAEHLLPQFEKNRQFNYNQSVNGLKQILWGLFKKVVIADNCAFFSDLIFDSYSNYNGLTTFLGAFFFSLQIYGDFSGYSDIAIGVSKLFGFELNDNFKHPYFSKNIIEFWKRWHISLTNWFRDYVYIPLGGNRKGIYSRTRNIIVVFLLSGLWHGANYTFIFWGFINAVLLLINSYFFNSKKILFNKSSNLIYYVKILFTFLLVTLTWIFFRAKNIKEAFLFIKQMFMGKFLNLDYLILRDSFSILMVIVFFFIIEWKGKNDTFTLQNMFTNSNWKRWCLYLFIAYMIVFFWQSTDKPFIYFQF
ncbi:MBOAT family protein [Flavobacterium sp. J27]|uniref:MBOAT family O-acyltransferase n=1 Tax=Flavobacterium sp. J27 TaxID=2060419 RepID=UPI00351115C7